MAHYNASNKPGWGQVVQRADSALERMHRKVQVPEALRRHRRGGYVTLPCGYGFGGGRAMPGSYANSTHNASVIQEALADLDLQNVARMVDRGLLAYFPRLHALAANLDKQIVDIDNPQIERAFPHCCYPALHFNLHNAWALIHEDFWNLIFFMCAVVCLGQFDHTRGGHLIAWSLGLVLELPAGTTVYLPSACVPHSNTPVAPHEHRSSMAFFVPAGLARWYHNGFHSDKEFRERASAQQLKAWQEYRSKLWEFGVELLRDGDAV